MCLKNLDDGDALMKMQTLEVGLRLIGWAPFYTCSVGNAHRFKSEASSQKLVRLCSLLTKVALCTSLHLAISVLPGPSHCPP